MRAEVVCRLQTRSGRTRRPGGGGNGKCVFHARVPGSRGVVPTGRRAPRDWAVCFLHMPNRFRSRALVIKHPSRLGFAGWSVGQPAPGGARYKHLTAKLTPVNAARGPMGRASHGTQHIWHVQWRQWRRSAITGAPIRWQTSRNNLVLILLAADKQAFSFTEAFLSAPRGRVLYVLITSEPFPDALLPRAPPVTAELMLRTFSRQRVTASTPTFRAHLAPKPCLRHPSPVNV